MSFFERKATNVNLYKLIYLTATSAVVLDDEGKNKNDEEEDESLEDEDNGYKDAGPIEKKIGEKRDRWIDTKKGMREDPTSI